MDIDIPRSEFDQLVEKTLELWHVPGLAVAVIKDEQVILCQGFGLRNIAGSLPVTPATLFQIGSCTKAITALSIGLLVDAFKLEWDKPVKNYLPSFKMWDDFATERITPRDLLTHRSGLPGHDMLWYASDFRRREILERLRYLEPTCDLRYTFQYQNMMYMVAGLLVEEITGMSWEQFVQTQIFDRLGMVHSNFSTEISQQSCDFALPYFYRDGQLKEIPFLTQAGEGEDSATGPAGEIWSNIGDMAKWLKVHLNGGKIGEQPFISAAALEELHAPQIFVDNPAAKKWFGGEFHSYGMGWTMRAHKGHLLMEHDGMRDGFYALTSMMPHAGIGIVALSNCDTYYNPVRNNLVPNIITYTLYDLLLGLEPTDWNFHTQSVCEELTDAVRSCQGLSVTERKRNAPLSHPLHEYLGEYEHPGYGVVSIRKIGEQLQIVINNKLTLPLEHFHYDIFEVVFDGMVNQRQKISFLTDLQGDIAQVAMRMEPRVKDIFFTRLPN
jgi:CubicO group peptidase (beta-lactamase class C family)